MDSSFRTTKPVLPAIILTAISTVLLLASCMTYRQTQEPEPEVVEAAVVETVPEPSAVVAEEDVPLPIPDAPETSPEEPLPSVEAPEPVHETEITDPWFSGYESDTYVFDFQEAEVQEISEEPPYAEEPVIQETVENPEPAEQEAEAPSGGEWAWISPADGSDADHDEPEPAEDLPSEPPLPASSGRQEPVGSRPWTEILLEQPVGWLIALEAALVLFGTVSLIVLIARMARRRRHGRKDGDGSHDGGSGETEDLLMQALMSGKFAPVPEQSGKGDAG